MSRASSFAALFVVLAACGGSTETQTSASSGASSTSSTSASTSGASSSSGAGGASSSSSSGSGGAGGMIDKAAKCTGTFGNALTNAFGRVDGTVLAVVKPTDVKCPAPNSDHVILEVVMNGAAYRMVINVKSSFGNPEVFYLEKPFALPGPAWSEGWHTGVTFDYVKDGGLHANQFMPFNLADLSNKIADAITIGQKVSVYATSSGGDSAHLVHRNDAKADGLIVLDPDQKTSRALFFHFGEQMF